MVTDLIKPKLLKVTTKLYLLDIALLILTWLLPVYFSNDPFQPHYLMIPIIIQLALFLILGNYDRATGLKNFSSQNILVSALFGFIITFFIFKFLSLFIFDSFYIRVRYYFFFSYPIQVLLYTFLKITFIRTKEFIRPQTVMVIGSQDELKFVKNWLKTNQVSRLDFRVMTLFDAEKSLIIDLVTKETKLVLPHFKLYDELIKHSIVIYFGTQKLETRHARNCLRFASERSAFFEFPSFCGLVMQNYPVDILTTDWYVSNASNLWIKVSLYLRFRAVVDSLLALILLVLILPFLVLIAISIKLTSKGPIFYTQERVGLLGKKFQIIKFRTMKVDAEKDGPKLAIEGDSRITLLGSFFRKTRIDELPQILNVLKGEMSFIGPRPEREHFENEFKEHIPLLQLRNFIRPGITGLAQVSGQYANDLESYKIKLGYDLYYILNISPILDMAILLKTVRTIIFKPGY
jgi:exopolysaccharide biosynthesis polyprenyl glycosylphosphotransferase